MEKMIRPAVFEDAAQIGYVHYMAWQETYKGLIDAEYLAGLSVERSVKIAEWTWKNTAVAVLDGKIMGFCGISASRDEDMPDAGEVQGIYLLQVAQGKGLGRMLMEDALKRLKAAGYTEVILWVLKGNGKAMRFYEKAGFHPDGAEKTEVREMPVSGRQCCLTELRYRRTI